MTKWCRFTLEGRTSYGIVEDQAVMLVEGTPFAEHRITGARHALADVKLEIPVIPSTFYCVGVNYADHVRRMAEKRNAKPVYPQKPDIGYRANNALIAHEESILKPADAGDEFQYEGELVAVFGRRAKKVSRSEVDCLLGWTIGNDVSERGWQAQDRTLWRAKNADTFKPMGPWIETDVDLDGMQTTIRLNGSVAETFKTNNMIFDAATYISEVSKYCTFYPGDVMWMGTDGVPQNMRVGDTCEVEITGIGVLRNGVVAEA